MDIFHVIHADKYKKVKSILRKKPELVTKKRDGEFPLHVASEKGFTKIMELLLKHRAVVDAEDSNGWTPLHTACHYDNYDAMLLLLDHDADPRHRCNLGDTALHAAARNGNMQILERLVNYNIDLNAVNFDGWTALHRATYSNKEDAVMFLIIEGVDVDILTLSGKSAFDLALSLRNDGLAEIIIKYGHRQKIASQNQRKLNEEHEITLRLGEATVPSNNNNLNNEINFKDFVTNQKRKLVSVFKTSGTSHNTDAAVNAQSPNRIFADQLAHCRSIANREKENLLQFPKTIKTKLFKNGSDHEDTISAAQEGPTESPENEAVEDVSMTKTEPHENKVDRDADDENSLVKEDENECPVCLEVPLPPVHIYQCTNGHLYCGKCKQMPNMQKCPICCVSISGLNNRNRFAEETIKKLYVKKTS